jgi:hypothetical protein
MVAPTAWRSLALKTSAGSGMASPITLTAICLAVWPGLKVSHPFLPT